MCFWYGLLIKLKLELLKSQVIASAWRGALLEIYRLTFIQWRPWALN